MRRKFEKEPEIQAEVVDCQKKTFRDVKKAGNIDNGGVTIRVRRWQYV
jgi:hypothetical protein